MYRGIGVASDGLEAGRHKRNEACPSVGLEGVDKILGTTPHAASWMAEVTTVAAVPTHTVWVTQK